MGGLLGLLVLAGCASPGPPRSPSLNLPEAVSSFAAQRVGDRVELRWTTPAKTTDGLDVRGPMSALVCRRSSLSTGSDCPTVLRLAVAAGSSSTVDQLPAPLTTGAVNALEYRIEIQNTHGRSAGQSRAVFAVGGFAPPPLREVRVEASRDGAVLTWRPDETNDPIELVRVAEPAGKPQHTVLGIKESDTTRVVLRVTPGLGALDRTARMGERYTYTAQRVRTVVVAGHTLEVRGAVSAPVSMEMRDLFPPREPTGLEAVAGDRVVDLSWEPNTEADLAGYLIQRQEAGLAMLLNTIPSPSPSFQDKTALPGHSYIYTIVAVDKVGNRSPPGEPARVSLRPDVP